MTELQARIQLILVDDEDSLRDAIATFLTWHGIVVSSVSSAVEALAVLGKEPAVTVVLTDIRMAGLDGLGLAERIRGTRGEADAVEVVLMTGHGDIDTATQAIRIGVFDFLRKPMQPNEMLGVVRRAHAKACGRRTSEARRTAELDELRADHAGLLRRLANAEQPLSLDGETPPGLANILSHELRTPLIPLLALPDLLETGHPLPAGMLSGFLADVRKSGARLLAVSDDLVEFLAPPSNSEFTWLPISVREIVESVRGHILPEATSAGVTVDVAAVDSGVIETYSLQLVPTLARLANNAITATSAGGKIELSAIAMSNDRIGFGVRDFGPGMTAEQLTLARQPFRQLDMSLTRRNGGMGLGLALAARMATSLGGELEMDSISGGGTSARVVLPRRRDASGAT